MARPREKSIYAQNPDGTVTIELTKGYSTVIDGDDRDLAELKWYARVGVAGVYAVRSAYIDKKVKPICLHRTILQRVIGRPFQSWRIEVVDHIDGNPLNNRRNNLRLATRSQNRMNSKAISKSGFKGVRQHGGNTWEAQITLNHKCIYLGVFNTPEEAHAAYCAAAQEYFGHFARFE